MSERIVLFGGTFDPIHHGHLIVARAVAEYFQFERVTFVPAYVPPHKTGGGEHEPARLQASAAERLEMIRLAIEGDDLFDVTDVELTRRPPSYTFDTLSQLRRERGLDVRLYWIIGADMLGDLITWRRAEEVVDMATVITAARPPYSRRLEATLEQLRVRFTDEQVSRLAAGVAPTPLIDIASTDIRRRVREGRSIRYLIPASVQVFIEEKRLYVSQ